MAFNKELLLELIEAKNYSAFIREIDEQNPVDIADLLASLPDEKQLSVFRMIKKDVAADIFAELDTDIQERIIKAASDKEISAVIEDLFVDDAVDMLEELPANMVARILQIAKPETRAVINKFLSYPEDSVGNIMTSEYIDLRENMTVEQALRHIRKKGHDRETVLIAYVTDKRRVLHGTINLETLLFSDDEDIIGDIMDRDCISIRTHDDKEDGVALISKYGLLALPVVDMENRLVGIVTFDDAIEVIEEENTEDIEIMAAILPSDKPYLKTSVFEIWKNRIPWLLILMFSSTFTGQIITGFESALSAFPLLIAFIPMLMGTGGNSGGQASATIVRGLAIDEIQLRDILQVIWKELRVATLCGVALAIGNFIKIILLDNLLFGNNVDYLSAFVISLTLLATVIIAKIVGGILPIVAKKIGFDPAVMASPFITTIVDAITLLIYFAIATLMLGI